MATPAGQEPGQTILVVDDFEPNRFLVKRWLEMDGFAVCEAETGAEALRMVEECDPDLVVLDVHLPDIHGFEVCRRIKTTPASAGIPVLHLSAAAVQPDDRVEGLEGGADGYLTQPVHPAELIATVKALIRMRRAERSVRRQASRWRATFDAVSDPVCLVAPEGVILECNEAFAELAGSHVGAVTGTPLDDLDETLEILIRPAVEATLPGGARHHEIESQLSGRWFRISSDAAPEDGGVVITLHDITSQKRYESELHHRATHDALTGLPNRALLEDRITMALARGSREGFRVAVLYLDLDGFKEINDGYGHAFGDRVLVAVAGRLQSCLRTGDTIARLGGDEFVIVAPAVRVVDDIRAVAKKILEVMSQPLTVDDKRVRVTVSIGIALSPALGGTAEALLDQADKAMYKAKSRGRNTAVAAKNGMTV